MGYNILLKIVALAVVFVIVTSCVTSTVAVADDSSNTAVSIRSEEFNGALAIIPSPFPSPMLPPFYEGRLFTTTAATPEHPPPPLPKPFENEIDMPVSEEDFSNPLFVDEDPFNYTDDPFRYPPDETAYPPSPPVSKENISRRTLEKLDQKVSHSNTSHSSNTIYVPDDYAKIQWAVDNASAGDTIIVDASGGPYYENVVVNKQLYLLGNGMPIVDAGGSSSAITISADGITLEGFSAKNSGSSVFDAGIEVTADNNIIAGNNLSGNNEGIYLQSSCNNIIKNNSADHNRRGIYLGFSSNDNTVIYNSAKNSEYGILIEGSSRNTIQDNFVNNNGPLETDEKFGGIRLYNARDNIILNNTAVNNTHGILLMRSGSNDNHIVGNYVQDNRLGIYLWDKCSGNIIRDNNLSNNIYGIRLYHSDSNTITDNLATNTNVGFGISGSNCTNINNNLANNNNIGFSFSSSNNNTVNNNTANSNSRGIMLSFVSNHIFRNNLMSSNEYNFYADGYAPNDIDISNLVDGKPIYYLVGASDMVIDLSSNACTVYCIDCNNISVMNLNLSYKNYHGVYFYNTSNSKILNNHIRENGKGIYFDSSSNNMIFNNSFNDNEGGIYIWDSTKNVIKGNKGSNNGGGIYLGYSSNNSLKDNDLRYNNYGTCLAYSSGNDLKNNTAISNNLYGIRLFSSSKNNVANNNASNNDDYGIYLRSSNNNSLLNNTATSNNNKSGIFVSWYSNNNTITNNTANSNFYSGIEVSQSNNNTISNNSLNSNDNYGISLESANNNILINNNASDNSIGITLYGYSCYNTLTNNTANSNFLGIELGGNGNNTVINNAADMNRYGGFFIYSDNNILINNTASNNNDSGIEMEYSSGNTLTNNRMSGNNYNFGVSGDCLSHFIHDIDTSNSGDGKPVYYWIDQKDQQIPADAGFVGIVNSTNIMVRDLILTNNSAGVLLAYSSNSTIENVKASNNIGGIWLIGSDSNRLTNSTFSKNYYGVYLDYSSNNSIFRNNFINNTDQANGNTGTNSWDNGYPSGGNYWSDYNGSDSFSGPYQNITGSDGIGDTPYNISGDAGAKDYYPLMEPGEEEQSNLIFDGDLIFSTLNHEFNNANVYVSRWNEPLNISVNITNIGEDEKRPFNVTFYSDCPFDYTGEIKTDVETLESVRLNQLVNGEKFIVNLSEPWVTLAGYYNIYAVIDPMNEINQKKYIFRPLQITPYLNQKLDGETAILIIFTDQDKIAWGKIEEACSWIEGYAGKQMFSILSIGGSLDNAIFVGNPEDAIVIEGNRDTAAKSLTVNGHKIESNWDLMNVVKTFGSYDNVILFFTRGWDPIDVSQASGVWVSNSCIDISGYVWHSNNLGGDWIEISDYQPLFKTETPNYVYAHEILHCFGTLDKIDCNSENNPSSEVMYYELLIPQGYYQTLEDKSLSMESQVEIGWCPGLGMICGFIKDGDKVISDPCTIRLTHAVSGQTDEYYFGRGKYQIAVGPGSYTLVAGASGYSDSEPKNVVVNSVGYLRRQSNFLIENFNLEKKNGYLKFKIFCPVDMIVQDPSGKNITKEINEIPDSYYLETDLNNDFKLDDYIYIDNKLFGPYRITVIPEDPDNNNTETYTLHVDEAGTIITLADNISISDIPAEPYVFESIVMTLDTKTPANPYPSIAGTHNGTLTLNQTIKVSKLCTYPCPGTGGHTEYVKLWNSTGWNVTATWNGYVGDWHNLTFNESFTLYKDETYNFTIKTGSYPQIIHESPFNATGGTIRCTSFEDANGEVHADWIPAIRLE